MDLIYSDRRPTLALRCFLLCLISLGLASSDLQAQRILEGVLVDSLSREGVRYASACVYAESGKVETGAICDSTGRFRIEKVPMHSLIVEFRSVGYISKRVVIAPLERGENRDLGIILLQQDNQVLQEVTVRGDHRLVDLKPGRKVLNLRNMNLSGDERLTDVLQVIPEVGVKGNQITLKNRSFQVFVNGRPSATGMQMLQDGKVADVERIEVITNPSVKYSPEGLGGIVNLVMKKSKLGMNGLLQSNYATDGTWGASLTWNYRRKKWNFFGTTYYTTYDADVEGHSILQREDGVQTDCYESRSYYKEENLKIGVDYDFTSRDLMTFYFSQRFIKGGHEKVYRSEWMPSFGNNQESMAGEVYHEQPYVPHYWDFSLFYQHLFSKEKRRMELSADYGLGNGSDWDRTERKGELYEDVPHSTYRRNSDQDSKYMAFASRYCTPLWDIKDARLEMGIEVNWTKEEWKEDGSGLTKSGWRDSTELDHYMDFSALKFSPYVVTNFRIGQIFIETGLRLQHYRQEMESDGMPRWIYDDTRLFGSLAASYNLGKHHALNVSYGRRIQRPSQYQLYPYERTGDFENERNIGNSSLSPAFMHSCEVGYSCDYENFSVNLGLSYMHTTDIIARYYCQEGEINYRSWKNSDVNDSYQANAGVYWNCKNLRLNFSGSLYREVYDNNVADSQNRSWNFNVRFSPYWQFKGGWMLSGKLAYYSKNHNAYTWNSDSWYANLRVNKTIRKWNFYVELHEILDSPQIEYSWGEGFEKQVRNEMHRRSLIVGFSYRMGERVKSRARTNLNTNFISGGR